MALFARKHDCPTCTCTEPLADPAEVAIDIFKDVYTKGVAKMSDETERFKQLAIRKAANVTGHPFTLYYDKELTDVHIESQDKRIAGYKRQEEIRNTPISDFCDKLGGCKICGGEIPYGHQEGCHLYLEEKRIKSLKAEIEAKDKRIAELEGTCKHCGEQLPRMGDHPESPYAFCCDPHDCIHDFQSRESLKAEIEALRNPWISVDSGRYPAPAAEVEIAVWDGVKVSRRFAIHLGSLWFSDGAEVEGFGINVIAWKKCADLPSPPEQP